MEYYCNPIPVEYKYQYKSDNREGKLFRMFREAADPSVIWFKGKYFLFASMSLGVYVSEDLITWSWHALDKVLPLYDYAPDAAVIDGYIYLCASRANETCDFYRTKDILNGPYERMEGSFPFWDPHLFYDDDGRIYLYWGSSNAHPIYGMELSKETMKPVGERKGLIFANEKENGFERFGQDHIPKPKGNTNPYLEGAWMNKHNGKYYLQYASPATEFNIYNDGVYVGDSPLGPFELAINNPYSYFPGGFMPGAGHGSTFSRNGKEWWHTSTMQISKNNNYERRLGIWRAGFDEAGELYCDQRYGDWPIAVGEGIQAFEKPHFYLLSYGKRVSASSWRKGAEPKYIVDENTKTCWKAADPKPGEWITVDLGEPMDVKAVQVNFADLDCMQPIPAGKTIGKERYISEEMYVTRWVLEGSLDGENYVTVEDKSQTNSDISHDFWVCEKGIAVRYLKLTIIELPFHQCACVSGLRVFGRSNGQKPEVPEYEVKRTGGLDMVVNIRDCGAVGYNILWGHAPEKLYHSYLLFGVNKTIGALVDGREYYVRVDAFNEAGITEGKTVKLSI